MERQIPSDTSVQGSFLPSTFTNDITVTHDALDTGTQTLDPRRFLPELLSVADVILLTLSLWAVASLWQVFDPQSARIFDQHLVFGLVVSIAFSLFAFEKGLYNFQSVRWRLSNLTRLGALLAATGAVVIAFLFALGKATTSSLCVVAAGLILGFCAICGIRRATELMLRSLTGLQDVLTPRIAIVGPAHKAQALRDLIETYRDEGDLYRIVGVFSDPIHSESREEASKATGSLDNLIQYAFRHRLDEIIIVQPSAYGLSLQEVKHRLACLPVPIRLCPEGTEFRLRPTDSDYSSELGLITLSRRPIDGLSGLVKDIFDRICALGLLLLTGPLLLMVAIAIKLESPGPVFFRQRRHGFNHRVFQIWKFRTMSCLEDGPNVKQASEDGDERITKLGAFLRKTSIDELPQLFNVLIGDMSVVGPRPHALSHNDHYCRHIGNYACRHTVKPGMTGLAQVEGWRGETKDVSKMGRRVYYDLKYIDRWSLALDLQILLRTFGILVTSPKAQDQDKTPSLSALLDSVYEAHGADAQKELFRKIEFHEKPLTLAFLNAHGFNLAWKDEKFRNALLGSDYLMRDGIGMKIADLLLGKKPGLNMNGSDLIPDLLKQFRGRRVAILGTEDPWLSEAVDKLTTDGINVVWTHHGFEPLSFYVEEVKSRDLEVIILAMGMPKQELVAQALLRSIQSPSIIVSGGFVIDFIAGRKPRAPVMLQRMGMEWLFRLVHEPQRLFRRYVIGNPLFLWRVCYLAFQSARHREAQQAEQLLIKAPALERSSTSIAIAAE